MCKYIMKYHKSWFRMIIRQKPWGKEIIYAHDNGLYIGKIIRVKKGSRLSLQDHVQKHETFFLDKGVAEILLNGKKYCVSDRDSLEDRVFVVEPKKKHRIKTIKDCTFLEVSTDYPDDVRRYEDDYGRENK